MATQIVYKTIGYNEVATVAITFTKNIKKTKIRIIKSFFKTAGNSGNAGNPLREVTEKCPYPLSPSTAPYSAQHELKAPNNVALTQRPSDVAHAVYTAQGSLIQ